MPAPRGSRGIDLVAINNRRRAARRRPAFPKPAARFNGRRKRPLDTLSVPTVGDLKSKLDRFRHGEIQPFGDGAKLFD